MTITGIITAILIGIVVGVLGRLLVPGKQPIGMLVTILIGIVGAFVGTAIARALGIPDGHKRHRLAGVARAGHRRSAGRRPGLDDDGPQAYRSHRRTQAFQLVPLIQPLNEPGGTPWPPGSCMFTQPSG